MAASVHDRIATARRNLVQAGLPPEDAAIDAEVLARHALGWDRATLLAEGRTALPPHIEEEYARMVARRANREPVALITGTREFWGRDFEVTRDVLIPRPETELIVESAVRAAPSPRRVLDVGTGSGCLAVTLAAECAQAFVVATDTSGAALEVARRNAARHGVLRRVRFVRASLLEALGGTFDLIVSNPPYIPVEDSLPPEVAWYEPAAALFGGEDGLRALRPLIAGARAHLNPAGHFIVEFGFGQAEDIEKLARAAGWPDFEIVKDLQQIPRVAVLSI